MPAPTAWDDFRLVKAIAESGSLVGASEALGLNHSTVFRRLGALEQSLGTRLFDRARAGYVATAAGEEMVALAARMAQEIVDFERKVAGRDVKPAGELRVTTNDTFVMYILIPILAGFRETYPDIRLDVIVANQALNLSRRDADVAIRATHDPPETLVGRRITNFAFGRYVSRAQFEARQPFDEAGLPWIGYSDNLMGIPAARWLRENVGDERVVYRSNTVLGLAEAVAAGIGLGLLPCFIADQRDDIVRFGPVMKDLGHSLWLLTHPDIRNSARVRAFMDYAGAELLKMRRRLEGDIGPPQAGA